MLFETKKKITAGELKTDLVFFEGARACYFYTQYLIVYQTFCRHPVWPQNKVFVSLSREHYAQWYFFVKNWNVIEWYLKRFFEDPDQLQFMEKYLTGERDKGVSRLSQPSFSSVDASELAALMEFYFEQFVNLMVTAAVLRMADRAIVRRLQEVFAGASNVDECIATAAIPQKPSFAAQEDRAVLTLASQIEQGAVAPRGKEFARELERIRDSFCYGVMGYFNEPPKTLLDYELTINHALAKGATSELRRHDQRITDDSKKREQLTSTLGPEHRWLMNAASFVSYHKDFFKSSENKLEYYAEPLFEEASRRSGYPVAFVKDLHPREILGLIEGKKPDKQKVTERVAQNVVIGMPGKLNILVGAVASAFEKQYLAREESGKTEKTEWKGRVASRGFATGAAKIVLGGKDFAKLRDKDILVVSNTSPDFVPIMRRAAAIVAEEGGLTAHVSVVSREFGIPCVVGIPHITTILKDGDRVEVDAERGVVTVLKRAKSEENTSYSRKGSMNQRSPAPISFGAAANSGIVKKLSV